MDLLDNARTFLQRANHLHQNLVLKTRKRSFAFVRHSNLPRVTERENRLRVTAERRLYKWSKGASGREIAHTFRAIWWGWLSEEVNDYSFAMSKVRTSLLLAIVLTAAFLPAAQGAEAPPKAGAICKKANSKVTYQAKIFTCLKSGKKLKWNKGVAVAMPTPASPTATPTPTVAPAVSIDNLTVDGVYNRSRQEIKNAIDGAVSFPSPFDFVISPNVDSWRVDILQSQYADGAKLWSQDFKPTKITILVYNFADKQWAETKYTEITGRPASNSQISGCQPTFCGNASATTFIDKAGKPALFIEQGNGFADQGLWNRSSAVHEYTHLYQNSFFDSFWNTAPYWLVEGSAQFYGEAASYVAFDKDRSTRSGIHTQYTRDFSAWITSNFPGKTVVEVLKENKAENTAKIMKAIETSPQNSGQVIGMAYLMGSYAAEVLVAVYGHQKFNDFYKSFATSTNYSSNFEKTFGITTNDFYLKLTPYLAEMARTELR